MDGQEESKEQAHKSKGDEVGLLREGMAIRKDLLKMKMQASMKIKVQNMRKRNGSRDLNNSYSSNEPDSGDATSPKEV